MKTLQINRPVLDSLYGNSSDSMFEVFTTFLGEHAVIRQNLFSSFHSGNTLLLQRALHHHAPSFMYLGLPIITDSFRQMEHLCKNKGENESMSIEFTNLIALVDRSKAIIEQELSGMTQYAVV